MNRGTILGQLEELHLLEGQEAGWAAAADYAAAHPEAYQALLAWGEQFAALKDLAPDAPQIAALARAYAQSEAQIFMQQMEQLVQATATQTPGEASAAMFAVAGETLPLTPAQRRFIELVEEMTSG